MNVVSELPKIDFNPEKYAGLFAAYREDLEAYIGMLSTLSLEDKDVAKRFFLSKLEEKWLPLLDVTSSKILQDIQSLQAPKTDIVTSLTMKELLATGDNDTSDWLVPNFLSSSGLYILAAAPKTGKTVLVNKLIHAVTVTGEFLGRPVQKGGVLYIQLEENLSMMRKKARLSGFNNHEDVETSLVVNFSNRIRIERVFDLSTDLDWLMKLILDFKPKLVAIDSLRMATNSVDVGENTNEFGKMLYALQKVISLTETCCILIHHMNKGNPNASLVQRFSGHSSISAACDGLIGLTSADEGSGNRVIKLETKPRDGVEMTIYYTLKKNNKGIWELEKLSEDTPADSIYTSKILHFLGSRPDIYFTAAAIAAHINADAYNVEYMKALEYLDNSELLLKEYSQHGVKYCLSSKSLWLVNPEKVESMVSPAVLDANSLLNCKTKRDLRNLVKGWTKEREMEAKKILLPDERLAVKALVESWEFQIGEEVVYEGVVYKVTEREAKNATNTPSLSKSLYYLEGLDTPVYEYKLNKAEPQVEEPETKYAYLATPMVEEYTEEEEVGMEQAILIADSDDENE